MITDSWIVSSLGLEKIEEACSEANRRRLQSILASERTSQIDEAKLRFIVNGLELAVFDLLDDSEPEQLVEVASNAFLVARVLRLPDTPIERAEALVRLGCLGVLGDRSSDVHRVLRDQKVPSLPLNSKDWGVRVWATILDVWIRLFRQQGWDDFHAIQERILNLRTAQKSCEPEFLQVAEQNEDAQPAWELVSSYHLARAAEILATYQCQGSVDEHYDIREQLETQFDRAINATSRGLLVAREMLVRLLARTAKPLVENCIWTVTRAVNSRVTKFVESMLSPHRKQPIFSMLPPQRRTLREEGLLGSSHRSVVVSLPTSGGKTLIAEFRILQALNQFDHECGWVAYLVPTRALVNQITLRLRRDFAEIACNVEKVSPALEIDSLESDMLLEENREAQFRVLVTTPEKFDLMLRGGWEQKIGRPLTLVVVDEAHGIGTPVRGLRLELLLATVNRECRYAQFLLLTPFIPNADEIARWLAPDSNKSIELGMDWVPNDRAIATARPVKGEAKGDFRVELFTQHTSRKTIVIPESLKIGSKRPLDLTWSQVSQSTGKLAAATAQILRDRGTVIVLVSRPNISWGVANTFKVKENSIVDHEDDLSHIQKFLEEEMGQDFPLISLLEHGIGVHHSGLSDDTRTIIEWLTENNMLNVLVATTTIAQGVNYPVSGVVFASHQYPYGKDMPPEDFWNIAGRAGRINQGDLGIVALAGNDTAKVKKIEEFVSQSVNALNSTLIEMVKLVQQKNEKLDLAELAWKSEWSAFVQYLAHTYRQIGDHDQFATQVEQVLRGTLGFRELRKSHQGWAEALVRGVYDYAEHIKGAPLQLVDATGFSWESVRNTLRRLSEARLSGDIWTPEIFGSEREKLRRMFGVLLNVPELREQLKEVTGGSENDGNTLSQIVCDWVQGRTLPEMAAKYFAKSSNDNVNAMTKCCSKVFGRLTQTASWGIAALQTLTMGDKWESLSSAEQRMLRNLPARIYYGVNSDEAVALRVLGIPRNAANPLASELRIDANQPLHLLRAQVRNAGEDAWKSALGEVRGRSYHRVWSIIEGDA
ncbi:MAG: DEAD/DEAH box helicase [Gammaproteobacteria bacterium]|nr:DEAD/DEAH box helicase [Gammaproteobacteria bacterium]MYI78017.1 DEAD/DEAH box helicase [Gammaproteobacteria bacterium]